MTEALGWPSQRVVAMLAVVICAVGLSISAWTHTPNWSNADSLFYQSMSFEVSGLSAQAARARIFRSPLAAEAIAQEPSVANRAWQSFESQFSRRRWLVPIAAALARPIAGERALPDISILGYYAFAIALSLILLTRFGAVTSVAVVALCLALGPVRDWELRPMTDSWGLALEVAALLLATKVVTRGGRWVLFWVLAMLALSFTRDLALIPLVGVAWVMWRGGGTEWRRRGPKLLVTGVAATIPAYLLFGASLRSTLVFQLSGYEVPSVAHATWSYVLSHYPAFAFNSARSTFHYMRSHPVVGLMFAIGLVALFALPAGRDPWTLLLRGSALGWVATLALDPDYTHFRYELAGLPAVAFGLCLLGEHVHRRLISRRAMRPMENEFDSAGVLVGASSTARTRTGAAEDA